MVVIYGDALWGCSTGILYWDVRIFLHMAAQNANLLHGEATDGKRLARGVHLCRSESGTLEATERAGGVYVNPLMVA